MHKKAIIYQNNRLFIKQINGAWRFADTPHPTRAKKLANLFAENLKKYADQATAEVLAAGPRIS